MSEVFLNTYFGLSAPLAATAAIALVNGTGGLKKHSNMTYDK